MFNKPIQLDRKSKLFQKIAEIECKDIFEMTLDLEKYFNLQQENKQLKNKIELLKNSKSKNRNHG